MRESNRGISELFKRLWLPIASFAGAVGLVYNVIQLWRGDQKTVTWIVAVLSYSCLLVLLAFVGFSTCRPTIDIVGSSTTRTLRYPRFYKFARAGLVGLFLFLGLPALMLFRGADCKPGNKVVVLVANFDGPETKSYRITEQIIAQLRQSMSDYGDTLILPLKTGINEPESVSEQEGSEEARRLGQSKCATVVLWGWYGVTESDVLLTIHVENLTTLSTRAISQSEFYSARSPITELRSFQFQERLSKEMGAFALFITGIIRSHADDFPEAVRCFSAALKAGQWPENLITKVLIYINRGFAYLRLEKYGDAVADLSQAIQLNPEYAEAYNVRGATYTLMRDFPRAMSDYSQAIHLEPGEATFYHNRAYADCLAGDYQKALEDTSTAIQLDPGRNYSTYLLRGTANQMLGRYEDAIPDFTEVIRQQPRDEEVYQRRSLSYSQTENYPTALHDISEAIKVNPKESNYYDYRGVIYHRLKDHQKALADFGQSIRLSPENFAAYAH